MTGLIFTISYQTCGSHLTTPSQNKNVPCGTFLFWWEWVDSNHLRLKPTDLQSAPALQLRRTPNLYSAHITNGLFLGAGSGKPRV